MTSQALCDSKAYTNLHKPTVTSCKIFVHSIVHAAPSPTFYPPIDSDSFTNVLSLQNFPMYSITTYVYYNYLLWLEK